MRGKPVEKPQEHRRNPIEINQLAVGVHRPGKLVSEAKLGYRPPARQHDKSQVAAAVLPLVEAPLQPSDRNVSTSE